MYPNLLEAPCGENLHIVLIDNEKLADKLGQFGIAVDTAIVKLESDGGASPDIFICGPDHSLKLKMPPHQARQVYVRTCEICWSCGECHPQGR